MSFYQKRMKGRVTNHPKLGEGELKLNDSGNDEMEVDEINNAYCELIKQTRNYKLSK